MIASSMSFHIFSVLQPSDSRSLFRVDSFLGTKTDDKGDTCRRCPATTGCTCVPFAALVLVMDKVLTVLVDEVVCEVHADIILTDKTDKGSSAMFENTSTSLIISVTQLGNC